MVTLSLNFGSLALELFFLLSGIFIFMIDRFIKSKSYAFWLSFWVILGSMVFILFIPFGDFTRAFRIDFFSSSIKFLLLIGFFFVLLLSDTHLNNFPGLNFGEFYGLLFFSLFGIFVVLSSQDFLTLFIGLELMSIPLYFLIATQYVYRKESLEGALKYFIAGALSGGLYILFLGIVYYATGTIYFEEVSKRLAQGLLKKELLLGAVFFISALSIKLSLVPFHMWAPDAYEASPLPITAFLSGLIKFAVMAVLIKVLILAYSPLKIEIGKILIPISLLTILIGSLLAIRQDNLVRLLAYSSIAHVGYAVLGLVSGDFAGYGFSLFYMFVYLFTTIGSFGIMIYLVRANRGFLEIPNLAGICQNLPFISLLLLIFLFSLAGVPPTAGFMAKFYIFLMLVKSQYIGVAILALLVSVIGAYPYIRVIKVIYMDKGHLGYYKPTYPIFLAFSLIVATFIVILLGIYPRPMLDFIQRTLFLYISLQFLQL